VSTDPGVREHLAALSPTARERVSEAMRVIGSVLPDADVELRYGVPTFRIASRNVMHVGGYADFISTYPVPEVDDDPRLADRIAEHRADKGTLRYPHSEPLPHDLIAEVARRLRAARGV
jgi:uncharacterized protein YdhG (YjbR/CyaY superfamily)